MTDRKEHPMVSVPDALRCVLRETARSLLQSSSADAAAQAEESVAVDASLSSVVGRVLSQDVRMASPGYPPYRASIMDGYAVSSDSSSTPMKEASSWTHQVVDRVYAGAESTPQLSIVDGTLPNAYYITTGAAVPDSCDCVIPIEQCQVSDDGSRIAISSHASLAPNTWIRKVGSDIAAGEVVLARGHVIDSVSLGLIHQAGVGSIHLCPQIKVGVLSTGNELLDGLQDKENPTGKIPDVNRPILLSLMAAFGAFPVDLGMERDDDVEAMARTLQSAIDSCDVVITTGGISMGETDIVEHVLVDKCHGVLHFGRMHMKPGKPTTFVTVQRPNKTICLVFAMPGNPVSATVCSHLLVKPCLDMLLQGTQRAGEPAQQGAIEGRIDHMVSEAWVHPELWGTLTEDLKLDKERPEYHRVMVDNVRDGKCRVSSTGTQRSSRLVSLRDAQGLMVLPQASPGRSIAKAGDSYPVLVITPGLTNDAFRIHSKDSVHLEIGKQAQAGHRIAIVEVLENDQDSVLTSLETSVSQALSGSKSGSSSVASRRSFKGRSAELYDFCVDVLPADFVVVCHVAVPGSFPHSLELNAAIQSRLTKLAPALAAEARKGAAAENPAAAMFETTVGFMPEKQGAMMIFCSNKGISGSLGNVRGLLKHALNVGRGKAHNHHHHHRDHQHQT